MELYASYFYQSATRFFESYEIALHNVSKFFQDSSNVESEHAEMFQKYEAYYFVYILFYLFLFYFVYNKFYYLVEK